MPNATATTTVDSEQIAEIILDLLRSATRPWTMREIEQELRQRLAVDNHDASELIHTFDVRDAVWGLIRQGRADFTPLRSVQATCGGPLWRKASQVRTERQALDELHGVDAAPPAPVARLRWS